MKYFITFSLLFLLVFPVIAAELRDLPERHWAHDSVYQLIKMGVTSGYPDGTFRGTKPISRYEVAAFLSKFAQSFYRQQGINEKLIEELKSELALKKYQREKAAKETQFSGEVLTRARNSTGSARGGRLDYRVKLNLAKSFSADSSLKIKLDTVDSGFNTDSTRNLTTNLIDIESKFRWGRFDYKINLGPGVVVHTEPDEHFPSENYTVYIRPKTALKVSAAAGKLDYSLSYVTRQVATSGLIGVHEVTGKVGYDFGLLTAHLQPRYLFIIDGIRNTLVEIGVDYRPDKKWETNLLVAAGALNQGTSAMYIKFIEQLKDPLNTGTNIVFRFDKAGNQYRTDGIDKYEFVYLNNFDRLICDGTADIGLKVNQKISNELSLEWKGDYVTDGSYNYGASYAETYFLWQLGLAYKVSAAIGLNTFYKSYNVPNGVAQFSDAVPTTSSMLGIEAKCAF
ncbi:S-layer homology domain-containing protein [Candidatus Margulisiibacteriota bacterium]